MRFGTAFLLAPRVPLAGRVHCAWRRRVRLWRLFAGPARKDVGRQRLGRGDRRRANGTSSRRPCSTTSRTVEDWTLNGPYLDGISFVTGLKGGKTLVRQTRRDDRQVPKFRSNMTAPEIAAMIESLFRVRGGTVDFKTTGARTAAVPRRQRLPV